MELKLIEKKDKPRMTEVSFTKKEFYQLPEVMRLTLRAAGVTETARKIKLVVEGDLLNGDKAKNLMRGGKSAKDMP